MNASVCAELLTFPKNSFFIVQEKNIYVLVDYEYA